MSAWDHDGYDRERDRELEERGGDESHAEWVEAEAIDRARRARATQEDEA